MRPEGERRAARMGRGEGVSDCEGWRVRKVVVRSGGGGGGGDGGRR